MNVKYFLLLLPVFSLHATSYRSCQLLEQYKSFLEKGTYGQQNWSKFGNTPPKSRYHTFIKAFQHFEQHHGKIIVELGTTHSFVDGTLEGCDSNDIRYWTPNQPEHWDWGAGCFTLMAAKALAHCNPTIYTIDIDAGALKRCRIMTQDHSRHIQYRRTSSDLFLQTYTPTKSIDLIYLDTGYMNPIEPTAQLQLQEAKMIVERDLLSDNGIILIDDVRNQNVLNDSSGLGKSKYAIPYLLKHGFEIIEDEYQVMLRKKK